MNCVSKSSFIPRLVMLKNIALRTYFPLLALVLACLLLVSMAEGGNVFPLEPPDISSPRATLQSFLHYTNAFYKATSNTEQNPEAAEAALDKAIRCLDLSRVPPGMRKDVGIESMLQLREILDRIQLPELADVPEKKQLFRFSFPDKGDTSGRKEKRKNLVRWRIPHTEIVIGRVEEGSRPGVFLFTPETVKHMDTFYEKVREVPYKSGAAEGIYERYIYSSGWLIPSSVLMNLPDWLQRGYMGQAAWQWIGLLIILVAGSLLLWLLVKGNMNWKKRGSDCSSSFIRLLFPLSAVGLCFLVRNIIDTQINITGQVLASIIMGLEIVYFIVVVWAVFVGGNIITCKILAFQKIQEDALNADVIKLVCRLVTFTLAFLVFYRVGIHLGIPVTGIFASASIAGVAVALAARETLANFFGGVSIFLDRPFKAGDYIVLDTGERGEVKAVGMRSTRMQTRDDVLITIPNSVITNVKIVNQSAPRPSFRVRIKIGVAYGSDLDQVEKILLELAENNELVKETPAPRVRLRIFAESSINYELLVWATRPRFRGRLTHQLNREIYFQFNKNGIAIPFPQRDVYLQPGAAADSFQD